MNLLPQNKKEEIRKDIFIRFVFVFEGIILFWLLTFLVLLYNVAFYLNIQTPALEERLERERQTASAKIFADVEENIRELNGAFAQIKKVSDKELFNIPQILREIGGLVPSGISFRNISYHGEIISISGHAETRAQFIDLKDGFKNSSICADLILPVPGERDIDFSITCILNNIQD